jgi:hypothetical protein
MTLADDPSGTQTLYMTRYSDGGTFSGTFSATITWK